MGRPVRPELMGADHEARRYVMHILAEAARLNYPSKSAFAKEIARGSLSLPPTPDDPVMDQVGRYMIEAANEITRRAIMAHYGEDYPKPIKVRRLGMTINRFDRTIERFLMGLSGYLLATSRPATQRTPFIAIINPENAHCE